MDPWVSFERFCGMLAHRHYAGREARELHGAELQALATKDIVQFDNNRSCAILDL